MSLSVHELVASLPFDAQEEPSAQAQLQQLLTAISARPLPTGFIHRLWSMGNLQARVALAYFAYWLRSGYATADERQRLLNEAHLKAAVRTLTGMSYLRGIAMKVGQTLANYPDVMPREFVEALGKLNFEAPPMHFALLREQVRNELGAEPEDIFAEFDTKAFAAASLGQVHRARLKTGEPVAVKIQYPGIARTIDSDVATVLTLLSPMRLTREWQSIREQWRDIREMIMHEADYLREADHLRRARAVFRDDEGIVIPRPHERYTTQRVLAMDLLDGVHIDEYLGTYRSQAERDRYGELIMRASFRIAHGARLWYADSNPGNYLFLRDGRLGVIDFGCCRVFTPEEWDYYAEMGRAHRVGGQRLRDALVRACGAKDGSELTEEHMRVLEDLAHWYSDYLLHDGPWDFGDEAFMRRGIELIEKVVRKRLLLTLPVNTWICRQLIGLRAIAFRLGAHINMHRLDQEESKGIFH